MRDRGDLGLAPERGAGAGTTRSRGRHNSEQGPHLWGCDSGAGQGASPAGPCASTGSHPRGNPVPPSDAPSGDATVQARIRTRSGPALHPAPGSHPSGQARWNLLRPPRARKWARTPCSRPTQGGARAAIGPKRPGPSKEMKICWVVSGAAPASLRSSPRYLPWLRRDVSHSSAPDATRVARLDQSFPR